MDHRNRDCLCLLRVDHGKALNCGERMTTYAKLIQEQKDRLPIEYRRARELGASDPMHAVAIATHAFSNRGSMRRLNSGLNADAQAQR